MFPFPSILYADRPVCNLQLANILFDVRLTHFCQQKYYSLWSTPVQKCLYQIMSIRMYLCDVPTSFRISTAIQTALTFRRFREVCPGAFQYSTSRKSQNVFIPNHYLHTIQDNSVISFDPAVLTFRNLLNFSGFYMDRQI
jgi:hypothetical protein